MNGINPAVAIGRVFSSPGNSAENPVRVCQVNEAKKVGDCKFLRGKLNRKKRPLILTKLVIW